MGDDLATEMAALADKGLQCLAVQEARWGLISKIRLSGGGDLGLYQPRHPSAPGLRPAQVTAGSSD